MNDDLNNIFTMNENSEPIQTSSTFTVDNNVLPTDLNIKGKKGRKFTISNIRKDMNNYEKEKNRSAVMAGLCILGAAAAAYFHNQDATQVVSNELNSLYSLDVIGQYIDNIGEVTTLLSAGALGFVAKYLVDSKKLKKAQQQLQNLMNYVGLGIEGEKYDKSR